MIIPWEGDGSPHIIGGLLVVEGAKLRLCLNMMYVNAIQIDMADITGPGDILYTTGEKSGYWQNTMHESVRMYWGMEKGGTIWVWVHLPFGLALACRLYTLMKQ